jgi:hypothetical protein
VPCGDAQAAIHKLLQQSTQRLGVCAGWTCGVGDSVPCLTLKLLSEHPHRNHTRLAPPLSLSSPLTSSSGPEVLHGSESGRSAHVPTPHGGAPHGELSELLILPVLSASRPQGALCRVLLCFASHWTHSGACIEVSQSANCRAGKIWARPCPCHPIHTT